MLLAIDVNAPIWVVKVIEKQDNVPLRLHSHDHFSVSIADEDGSGFAVAGQRRIDRDLCIGAATCIALAPKAWALDDEAKAIILDTSDQESDNALLEAANRA